MATRPIASALLRRVLTPAQFSRFKASIRNAQNRVTGRTFALHRLDARAVEILGTAPGFFVEVGAGDGLDQSNTLLLERRYGWSGLLIEPVPRQFELCRRYRDGAHVVHHLLTSPQLSGREMTVVDYGLESYVSDARAKTLLSLRDRERRLKAATSARLGHQQSVTATTLSEILEDLGIARVDFLSLDVEGNELDVISGIDFARHFIRYLLVETGAPNEVAKALGEPFALVEKLSVHDYLFGHRDR